MYPASELLRAREAANVAYLARDRVGEKRAHAGYHQKQWDVGVVGTKTGELTLEREAAAHWSTPE